MQTSRREIALSPMRSSWLGQRPFDGPSAGKSRGNSPSIDAKACRPVIGRTRLSVEDEQPHRRMSDTLVRGECFRVGRAPTQAAVNHLVADIQVASPLDNSFCFAVEREPSMASSVGRLFSRRRPSAIARSVRTVIINAIDCVSRRRARANICSKRDERVTPPRVHCDATTAIETIRGVFRIVASVFDRGPHLIQPRRGLTMTLGRHLLKV